MAEWREDMLGRSGERQRQRDERAARASEFTHKESATRGRNRGRQQGDKQRRADNPDLQQDRQGSQKRPPSGAVRPGAPAASSKTTQVTGRAREEGPGEQNANYDTGD